VKAEVREKHLKIIMKILAFFTIPPCRDFRRQIVSPDKELYQQIKKKQQNNKILTSFKE
jgi:hypothetical protein